VASGKRYSSIDKVSRVVCEALSRGAAVEIDGLGSFRKMGKGYRFEASGMPRIFVAYVEEDSVKACRIFEELQGAGFDPWLDKRKLLPGQNWARAIRNALETSDFVLCCFSHNSLHKRGGFQAEIRYALESAKRLPLDQLFLLPVRLEECPVPVEIARHMQYVDLFPSWDPGIGRLVAAIRQQMRQRKAA
jgi:hypothetical protein